MGLKIGSSKIRYLVRTDIVFCFDCFESLAIVVEDVKSHVGSFMESILHVVSNTDRYVFDFFLRGLKWNHLGEGKVIQDDTGYVTDADSLRIQLSSFIVPDNSNGQRLTTHEIIDSIKSLDWHESCHKIVVLFTDVSSEENHKLTDSPIRVKERDFDDSIIFSYTDYAVVFLINGNITKEQMQQLGEDVGTKIVRRSYL